MSANMEAILNSLKSFEMTYQNILKENSRLSKEHQEVHSYNNTIVSENQELKTQRNMSDRTIDSLHHDLVMARAALSMFEARDALIDDRKEENRNLKKSIRESRAAADALTSNLHATKVCLQATRVDLELYKSFNQTLSTESFSKPLTPSPGPKLNAPGS